MSAMNLGLEALGIKEEKHEVLSYEYLDAVIEYSDACDELNVVFDQFDTVLRAAQNLEAVKDVIVAQGVTPALEALVGGNFKDGLSLEAVEASMEAADGAIVNFIKRIWAAIKQFFLKFFGTSKGMIERLQKFIKDAEDGGNEISCRTFTGIKRDVIPMLAITPADLDKAKANAIADKKTEDVEGEIELDHNSAIDYAKALLSAMEVLQKHKDEFTTKCENMVKMVSTANVKPEDRKAEGPGALIEDAARIGKERAANAKKIIDICFKGLFKTAAAFLSHTTVDKKADEKSAEGGEKK